MLGGSNIFNGTNLNSSSVKVSKGARIRNRYNQVPHLTQDTKWKVTNSHLDTTNESQEISPFPAGDHKAHTVKFGCFRRAASEIHFFCIYVHPFLWNRIKDFHVFFICLSILIFIYIHCKRLRTCRGPSCFRTLSLPESGC